MGKRLLHNHEELSLEPQSLHKQWSRVVCASDPTAGEVQTGIANSSASLAYLARFRESGPASKQ